MNPTYKDYNNYSQQDKDSMRTRANDISNKNEATLIGQTDEVESLLRTVISKLDTIIGHVDGVEGAISGNTQEVRTQGQAIVDQLQS